MQVSEKLIADKEESLLESATENPPLKKRLSAYWKFIIIYSAVILLLNIVAQNKSFSDFYDDNIFRYLSMPYCALTGLMPFSVGEILIPAAILIVLTALVLLTLLIFLKKKEKFKRFSIKYLKSTLAFILTVVMIMTLNCSILYCTSKMDINGNRGKKYSAEQIEILRNYVVVQCNELSKKMERKENGEVTYSDNLDKEIEAALNGLSDELPRLKGYYPNAKPIMGSYFMYQAGVIGVYFPFSMEANYNTNVSDIYAPSVIAHELSHLKGYIYEDEANFIAYLACTKSGNDIIRYSGYLSVLNYIDDDYYICVDEERYFKQVQIKKAVAFDNFCYDREKWKALQEQKPVVKTETVENISDTITDTYLDYYQAEPNYNEVTLLMLQYYDGILY